MKTLFYLILMMLAGFFLSCKKNSTSSTSSTAQSTSNVGYNGFLSVKGGQYLSSGTLSAMNPTGSIFFSSIPTSTTNPSTAVRVNSVSLNGVIYKFLSYLYYDTTYTSVSSPYMWVINGAGPIPSFTFTNTNPMPAFSGFNSLPDTIYKNSNNTIPITGVTGADTVTVIIEDFATHKAYMGVSRGSTSVTFSSSSLSSINLGNNSTIIIICTKNNVQMFGGKIFSFPVVYQLDKNNIVVK